MFIIIFFALKPYLKILYTCSIKKTITISQEEYDDLKQQLSEALVIIKSLRIEIELLKKGRDSNTSSTPSSQDFGKKNKIPNSRNKTGRQPGGQKGHKGSSLKPNKTPDEIIDHTSNFCKDCGEELDLSKSVLDIKRQEIVIPPIKPKWVEHRTYKCTCGKCGHTTSSDMPHHLKTHVQYGENVQALVTYLSVFQLVPAKRLKQFLKDFVDLNMSEGTIFNILKSMSKKSDPAYKEIGKRLETSIYVGGDETGIHINKVKAWLWVFQNNSLTYIKASYTRGFAAILEIFSNSFSISVYVSDILPAQLKIKSLAKQSCLSHLSRELKKFEEVFNSSWATKMKNLFTETIVYKKQMTDIDFSENNIKVKEFENRLSDILNMDFSNKHKKVQAFLRRLIKNRNAIFTFLYYKEVPPDNNGSERAIRNAKIKMKISNQFKSFQFAQYYATIRSVIDTATKNGKDIFNALSNIAKQELIPAE